MPECSTVMLSDPHEAKDTQAKARLIHRLHEDGSDRALSLGSVLSASTPAQPLAERGLSSVGARATLMRCEIGVLARCRTFLDEAS